MSKQQDSTNTIVIIVIIVFIVVMIIGSFKPSAPSAAPSVDHNGVEYNYAKEKFRQSGQSERDASTAAEAVIKFQRAQDARRNK